MNTRLLHTRIVEGVSILVEDQSVTKGYSIQGTDPHKQVITRLPISHVVELAEEGIDRLGRRTEGPTSTAEIAGFVDEQFHVKGESQFAEGDLRAHAEPIHLCITHGDTPHRRPITRPGLVVIIVAETGTTQVIRILCAGASGPQYEEGE